MKPAPSLTNKLWVRLLFTQPALSPVVWGVAFLLGFGLILWASVGLIFASFPHWLLVLLMLVTAWLTGQIETHLYRPLAPLYDGGWMPSLQKTWLTLGLFALLGLAGYGVLLNLVLGAVIFVTVIAGAWRYLPRDKKRKGLLEAFADLANATQRIERPGIRQVERLCLWACLLWMGVGGFALLDGMITTGHRVHAVRVLGKTMHTGGRGGPSYSVRLSGWRKGRGVMETRINRSTYDRLIPARDYELHTRRGLWGTERLDAFVPPPRTPEADPAP
ncbi:MAG: hypothetical protein ACO1RX_14905 [Candidatus Sericytochromatia bacterium]